MGSKYEPKVQTVDLIEANPSYAHVRFQDGREDTVSLQDLAPSGGGGISDTPLHQDGKYTQNSTPVNDPIPEIPMPADTDIALPARPTDPALSPAPSVPIDATPATPTNSAPSPAPSVPIAVPRGRTPCDLPRRSERMRKPRVILDL